MQQTTRAKYYWSKTKREEDRPHTWCWDHATTVGALRGTRRQATMVGALRRSRPWLPKSDQRELVAAPMAEAGWCSNARWSHMSSNTAISREPLIYARLAVGLYLHFSLFIFYSWCALLSLVLCVLLACRSSHSIWLCYIPLCFGLSIVDLVDMTCYYSPFSPLFAVLNICQRMNGYLIQ